MTEINLYKIKCQCGHLVDMKIYNSVNITLNPELLDKVKKREINNYKCDKCGEKNELAYQFLYHDMNKKQWIWVFPENKKKPKKEAEKELKELLSTKHHLMKMLESLNVKMVVAFGYNELFKLID